MEGPDLERARRERGHKRDREREREQMSQVECKRKRERSPEDRRKSRRVGRYEEIRHRDPDAELQSMEEEAERIEPEEEVAPEMQDTNYDVPLTHREEKNIKKERRKEEVRLGLRPAEPKGKKKKKENVQPVESSGIEGSMSAPGLRERRDARERRDGEEKNRGRERERTRERERDRDHHGREREWTRERERDRDHHGRERETRGRKRSVSEDRRRSRFDGQWRLLPANVSIPANSPVFGRREEKRRDYQREKRQYVRTVRTHMKEEQVHCMDRDEPGDQQHPSDLTVRVSSFCNGDSENKRECFRNTLNKLPKTIKAKLHPEGVLVLYNYSGQCSGEALVTFPSKEAARQAMAERSTQLFYGQPVHLAFCS